jgi:glutaredoxin
MAVIEFLTRNECPLCDEAATMLDTWAPRLGFEVTTFDVDRDLELQAEYGGRVPVARSPGGTILVEGRWSRPELLARLLRYRLGGS